AAQGRAIINADSEGGVVRRVPLIAAVGDTMVAGFAVELLRVAAGVPALTVHTNARGVQAVAVGNVHVPTESDGTLHVHYARHDATRFVAAGDVLAGSVSPETFKRKVVLFGVTAVGLSDYQPTPIGDRMSGVEIQAEVVENIVDGAVLSRPEWARWL